MSLEQFIQYVSWAVYILIFILTLIAAVRHPLRANIDIALFFGAIAAIILLSIATTSGIMPGGPGAINQVVLISLVVALGYLLLRLVDDFSDVPKWVMRSMEVMLVLLIVATFVYNPPRPTWLSLAQVIYLAGLLLYTVVAFIRESRRSSGVTRRRMQAVAFGSIWICILIVVAGVALFVPGLADYTRALSNLEGLISAFSYYLGFATPVVLRRAWQEPELRAFLGRAATLPRLPDTQSIVSELERGAAKSLGASRASIGIWDEEKGELRFKIDGKDVAFAPTDKRVAGQAFLGQKPVFAPDIGPDSPSYLEARQVFGTTSVLAAPITAGAKRLGVLLAIAPHTPIFADEDLSLVQLLADQAAVILESRALIDQAARVQAREEVTRLKEDFLSAAAHDLKTPLTTLVALTELLERRALQAPDAPADVASLQKLKKESHRLKTLVLELLDAARTEQGRLVGDREELDLVSYAYEVCSRHDSNRHTCTVEAAGPIIGNYDPNRILQLIENLVENAVKYSPNGGPVLIKLWQDQGWNHMTITDTGIGIPKEDIQNVFERFYRGKNVDDRHFAGMGLGLFICRGIAEQHGGRITVESSSRTGGLSAHGGSNGHNDQGITSPTSGTTFHIELPSEQTAHALITTPLIAGEAKTS